MVRSAARDGGCFHSTAYSSQVPRLIGYLGTGQSPSRIGKPWPGIPCHRSASSLFRLPPCVCVERICIRGAGNGRTAQPENGSRLFLEDNHVVNKRTFLRVLTSLLATPVVSSILAWAL